MSASNKHMAGCNVQDNLAGGAIFVGSRLGQRSSARGFVFVRQFPFPVRTSSRRLLGTFFVRRLILPALVFNDALAVFHTGIMFGLRSGSDECQTGSRCMIGTAAGFTVGKPAQVGTSAPTRQLSLSEVNHAEKMVQKSYAIQ
jgi:hypothetical protein